MIQISSMKIEDIPDAVSLWKVQFNKYCYCNAFPNFTDGGHVIIESYLKEQIKKDNAVVAIMDNNIVGFMAWRYFDFHNEKTAFLPIVGHAALLDDECRIYEEMYRHVSNIWVHNDIFNHLWMTYFDDMILKNSLYDLGFGSYVIDACQSISAAVYSAKSDYKISLASTNDIDALLEFANFSNNYYSDSPIFLKRSEYTKKEMIEWIKADFALIAWDKGKIIGVMSFTINQDFHFERLTTPDSARIQSVGAFIHPDYRGKGIGTALLEKAFAFCNTEGKRYLHVSFETANPDAIRFWPKYFKPAIRSVRRTVNKDANMSM